MRRMTISCTVALAALSICAAAQAPPTAQTPRMSPQAELEQARQLLSTVEVDPDSDVGRKVSALREHFADLGEAYLTPAPAPIDTAAGQPVPIGTSGQVTAGPRDWRDSYRLVRNDFADVLGNADASGGADTQIRPALRTQLQDIERHLQMFCAGTMTAPDANPVAHTGLAAAARPGLQGATAPPVAPTAAAPQTTAQPQSSQPQSSQPQAQQPQAVQPQPAPAQTAQPQGAQPQGTQPQGAQPATAPPAQSPAAPQGAAAGPAPQARSGVGTSGAAADSDVGTAIALLDRMQRVLDAAEKDPMGKVSIDRAALDELRAETTQVRQILDARRR
jgi:hypothetical protein